MFSRRHHAQTDVAHSRGLRTIAAIEFVKGGISLVILCALVALLKRNYDLAEAAQNLLFRLHISSERHIAHAFVDAAGRVKDASLEVVVLVFCLYATMRFIEAFGLWFRRVWAEWFAIISGLVYLPLEIRMIIRRPTGFHWLVLLSNLAIVGYIGAIRYHAHKRREAAAGR